MSNNMYPPTVVTEDEETIEAIVRLIKLCVCEKRYGTLIVKWQEGAPSQTLFERSAKSATEIDNL